MAHCLDRVCGQSSQDSQWKNQESGAETERMGKQQGEMIEFPLVIMRTTNKNIAQPRT